MVSGCVMTHANCEKERIAGASISLASDPMDSQICQRVVVEEDDHPTVCNEGGLGHKCKNGPYPVSFRSIMPKKEECANHDELLFLPLLPQ